MVDSEEEFGGFGDEESIPLTATTTTAPSIASNDRTHADQDEPVLHHTLRPRVHSQLGPGSKAGTLKLMRARTASRKRTVPQFDTPLRRQVPINWRDLSWQGQFPLEMNHKQTGLNLSGNILAYRNKTYLTVDDDVVMVTNRQFSFDLDSNDNRTLAVTTAVLSHDLTKALTGNNVGTLRVWALDSRPLPTIQATYTHGSGHPISAMAVSHSDTFFVSGSSSKSNSTMKLWPLNATMKKASFSGHEQPITALAVTYDDARVLSGSKDMTVRVWNIKARTVERIFTVHSTPITSIATSPSADLYASSSEDSTVRVWGLSERSTPVALGSDVHSGTVTNVTFVSGTMLSSGDSTGKVVCWQLQGTSSAAPRSGSILLQLTQESGVKFVTPGPAQTLVACTQENNVKTYRLPGGQELKAEAAVSATVLAVDMSHDNQWVVSGSSDHSVNVWDVAKGKLHTSLDCHSDDVTGVSIDPDNAYGASCSKDGTIVVWPMLGISGRRTIRLARRVGKFHTATVYATDVAITKDRKHLVASLSNGRVAVWLYKELLAQGKTEPLAYITMSRSFAHRGAATALAVSSNSQFIVSGGEDTKVVVWQFNALYAPGVKLKSKGLNGKGSAEVYTFSNSAPVTCVAISDDSRIVLSGGEDHFIHLWKMEDGGLLGRLEAHEAAVTSVAIAFDNQFAVSASLDNSMKLWRLGSSGKSGELEKDDLIVELPCDPEACDIVLSRDSQFVVAGTMGNAVKVWQLESGMATVASGHAGDVKGVTLSESGRIFASAGEDGLVKLFRTNSGAEVHRLRVDGLFSQDMSSALCVTLTEPQKTVFSGHEGGLAVWQLEPKEGLGETKPSLTALDDESDDEHNISEPMYDLGFEPTFHLKAARVVSVVVSQNQDIIVAGCGDGNLRIWPLSGLHSETSAATVPAHDGGVDAVALTPDGRHLLSTGTADHCLRGWALPSAKALFKVQAHEQRISGVSCLSHTGDTLYIATGSFDNSVKVWKCGANLQTCTAIRTFQGHDKDVTAVAGLSQGRLLSGSSDSTVKIWAMKSSEEHPIHVFEHPDGVTSLSVNEKQLRFISGVRTGHLFVWRIDNYQPIYCILPGSCHPVFDDLVAMVEGEREVWNKGGRLTELAASTGVDTDDAMGKSPHVLPQQFAKFLYQTRPQGSVNVLSDERYPYDITGSMLTQLLAVACRHCYYPDHEPLMLKRLINVLGNRLTENSSDFRLSETLLEAPSPFVDAVDESNVPWEEPSTDVGPLDGLVVTVHPVIVLLELLQDPHCQTNLIELFDKLALASSMQKLFDGDTAPLERGVETAGSATQLDPGLWRNHFFPDAEDEVSLLSSGVKALVGSQVAYVDIDTYTLPMPDMVKVHDLTISQGFKDYDAKADTRVSFLEHFVKLGQLHPFGGHVLRAIIQSKWRLYGQRTVIRALFLYLVSLSILVGFSVTIPPTAKGLSFKTNSAANITFGCLYFLSTLLELMNEIHQLYQGGWRRYITLWNGRDGLQIITDLTALLLGYMLVMDEYRALLSLAVYLKWLGLLYFMQSFRATGVLVRMIIKVVVDIRWFLLILGFVLLGCTNAFYVMIHYDQRGEGYESVSAALFSTFATMTLGDFDSANFTQGPFRGVLSVMFALTIMGISIVLLNLLIAILSDSYERVQDKADVEFQKLRAAYLVELEASMLPADLQDEERFPRWIHVMLPGESQGRFDVWTGMLGSMKGKVDERADKLEELFKKQEQKLKEILKAATGSSVSA
eukprot:m.243226 g.243226  ORF g.243226 m.243226 type:complete len:1747 (-) comp17460_c0_seq1:28-5268(-)